MTGKIGIALKVSTALCYFYRLLHAILLLGVTCFSFLFLVYVAVQKSLALLPGLQIYHL